MNKRYNEEYSDEEIFDPEGVEQRRRAEEEERIQRRIRREIIRINSGEVDEELAEERRRMDEEAIEEQEQRDRERRQQRSLWRQLFTGGILTSDGAPQYYRALIAIAAMCFLSIFLTFMSLNAERECRNLEKQATILRERSVLMEEQRYSISSKREVERMLRERGIEMIDLSNDSRLIER